MKVALDEHVPPVLRTAIGVLLEDERNGAIKLVIAKDYGNPPAKSDVPWLTKFKADGGAIVISADKKMRARLHERQAINDLGLICFFVPSQWSKWRFMQQSAYILRWWQVIVETANKSSPGECWQLPATWTPTPESLRNVTGPKKVTEKRSATSRSRRSATSDVKHTTAT